MNPVNKLCKLSWKMKVDLIDIMCTAVNVECTKQNLKASVNMEHKDS